MLTLCKECDSRRRRYRVCANRSRRDTLSKTPYRMPHVRQTRDGDPSLVPYSLVRREPVSVNQIIHFQSSSIQSSYHMGCRLDDRPSTLLYSRSSCCNCALTLLPTLGSASSSSTPSFHVCTVHVPCEVPQPFQDVAGSCQQMFKKLTGQ